MLLMRNQHFIERDLADSSVQLAFFLNAARRGGLGIRRAMDQPACGRGAVCMSVTFMIDSVSDTAPSIGTHSERIVQVFGARDFIAPPSRGARSPPHSGTSQSERSNKPWKYENIRFIQFETQSFKDMAQLIDF